MTAQETTKMVLDGRTYCLEGYTLRRELQQPIKGTVYIRETEDSEEPDNTSVEYPDDATDMRGPKFPCRTRELEWWLNQNLSGREILNVFVWKGHFIAVYR